MCITGQFNTVSYLPKNVPDHEQTILVDELRVSQFVILPDRSHTANIQPVLLKIKFLFARMRTMTKNGRNLK